MKKAVLIMLSLGTFILSHGQDADYSQFYANPLYLNPGFTGTSPAPRFAVNYRNQWPQKGSTYINYSVSYDQFVQKMDGGFGFQLQNNKELNGLVENSSAYLFYSHHIKINERLFFNAGLQAGMTYKKLDNGRLIFPDMIDQLTGVNFPGQMEQAENASVIYPDFGVGALGQYHSYFFGFSLMHLTQPDESFFSGDQKGNLPMKITVHAGARSHQLHRGLLSKEFTISPNLIYQQQGSFKQINLGMYILEKSLAGGIWYRQNLNMQPDAVILMVGFMREHFKIGYSYDLTLSELSNYSSGSHEVSLIIFRKEKHTSHKALLIPPL